MNLILNQVKEISTNRLKELYGEHINQAILERYNTEMELIKNNHYEDTYMLAYLIIQKAKADNEVIRLRSNANSSFIAYLLGISHINPIEYNLLFESCVCTELNFMFDISTEYMKTKVMYNYIMEVLDNASMEHLSNHNYEIRFNYNSMYSIKYNNCNIIISANNTEFTILTKLEEMTGIKHCNIDIRDKKLLEWIRRNSSEMEDIKEPFEFGSKFTKQMINTIKPQTFEELVMIIALKHGTDIWQNNNEELIKTYSINQLACNRDDVFLYLLEQGIDRQTAYELIKNLSDGEIALQDRTNWNKFVIDMKEHNIPQWYITSLGKVKYMFSKSSAYSFTILSLYLVWYAVYYSTEFKQVMEEVK